MAAEDDPELREAVLGADFTVPDGQPLVWAMNALGHDLGDRVYGPDLMDRACERAARTGLRMYLYGGRNQGALVQLARNLRLRYPGLQIVGGYVPPFRELTRRGGGGRGRRDQPLRRRRRVGRDRRAQAGEVDGADAPAARARRCSSASARRSTSTPAWSRRRPAGCSGSGSSGRSGWPRSRAGCGGATRATTRASWLGFARQCARRAPAAAARAPSPCTTSRSSGSAGSACRSRSLRRRRACACSASTRTPSAWRRVRAAAHAVRGAGHRRAARARRRSTSRARASDAAARRRDRAHARHADALAHRDRHGRHPLGARRPAAACCAPGSCSCCARRSRPGRPSSSPATWRSSAASRSARTCSSPTCPSGSPPTASSRRSGRCRASSAASARARASAPRGCSRSSARRSCRPRRSQAELAKIWTNILRYATFALPNLLMMDCERYGANVFDVIELINRDYPRGGMALPGLTAGTCLRKDFAFSEERSNAPGMLLAVSRVNECVPLFLVDGVKRRLGGSLRERKVAVLGLAFKRDTDDERDSLSHKLIRLLERELADVAVHDPLVATPTAVVRRGGRRTPTSSFVATNHTALRAPRALAAIAERGEAGLPDRRPVERVRRGPGLRLRDRARRAARREPRPRHGRRRHDRRGGGAAAAARPRLRGPGLRPARRAALDARGLRGPHRRPARPRRRRARRSRGCTHVIHLAAIVGGIANFHKLPHTLTEVNNALYNAIFRAALDEGVERFIYVSSSMVFERATSSRPPRTTSPRLPAAALGVRLLEAGRRGLLPRGARRARPAVHDLPPVQRLRAGRDARRRAGHRARRAGPDPQVARPAAPAADLRLRRADAHAHPRRRHRRRRRLRDVLAGGPQRGLQHLGRRRADRGRDRADLLGGVRQRPGRVRARAPAELRGRRAAALAVGGEGRAAARLAREDRRTRRASRRPPAGSPSAAARASITRSSCAGVMCANSGSVTARAL